MLAPPRPLLLRAAWIINCPNEIDQSITKTNLGESPEDDWLPISINTAAIKQRIEDTIKITIDGIPLSLLLEITYLNPDQITPRMIRNRILKKAYNPSLFST